MAPIEDTGEEDDISAFSDKGEDDNFLTQPQDASNVVQRSARRLPPRRSILRQTGPVPSKDLRRVVRQNIEAEEAKRMEQTDTAAQAAEDFPDADNMSVSDKENEPDPDLEKTLAELREQHMSGVSSRDDGTPSRPKKRKALIPWEDDSDVEEYPSALYRGKRIRHNDKEEKIAAPVTPKRTPNKEKRKSTPNNVWSPGFYSPGETPTCGHRKRPFTEEECSCIREGFQTLGPKWAEIRDSYSPLRGRTGQSIRDKYRTMLKHNEL